MTITTLKRIVAVICVLSIAGMIVLSIKNNIGGAMASGMVGAVAMLCFITGNAIHTGTNAGGAQEALAEELDARVNDSYRVELTKNKHEPLSARPSASVPVNGRQNNFRSLMNG
jgi:hypothetical protein